MTVKSTRSVTILVAMNNLRHMSNQNTSKKGIKGKFTHNSATERLGKLTEIFTKKMRCLYMVGQTRMLISSN